MKRTSWALVVSCAALGPRPSLAQARVTASARSFDVHEASITDLQDASAQTGLPALSIPAGFTADGLPVGIELLGRAFGDARLVAMGYAFEQLGPRRRAPFSTPSLVAGKVPSSVTFTTTATTGSGRGATARFTLDRLSGTLGCDVDIRGLPLSKVQAVVLLRRDSAGRGRVIQRLSGPDVASGSGTASLGPAERDALFAGQLYLSLVTADQAPVQARVVAPK